MLLACELLCPGEFFLGFSALAAGVVCIKRVLSTAVFLELPGVREALSAAAAGVQLHAGVDLHVRLELVGLPELLAAHHALVGFLSGVNQQVAVVVLWCPELLPTLLTPVWFDTGVQQLVLLQLRREQETFLTNAADIRSVAVVLPHVVQVQVSQVEGLSTGFAGELFVFCMALLVRSQSGAAAEALETDFAAEGFDSGRPASHLSCLLAFLFIVVNQLLVLLQLTVVEKCLPTQITHEWLFHTVNQHVGLQSPGPSEALPTLITPETQTET